LEVTGSGPGLLLPVDPAPVTGSRADDLRKWGVDPELGRHLVDGLADAFTIVAFPYENHIMANTRPEAFTPDLIAGDLLAVADAAGLDRFAYYGYSWLALNGLQLAMRTDRLTALVMGGYPPIDGPYAEMLRVTRTAHARSGTGDPSAWNTDGGATADWDGESEFDWSNVEMTATKDQTRQFVVMYEALTGFDDRSAQDAVTCPRMCFAGTADTIVYEEKWGGLTVDIAGRFAGARAEMEAAGWDVHALEGLDHTQAMQPQHVLPVLRPWLEENVKG
ncbi:MAG TPA: alpha/beta hydrolase, partial [Phytomonospora sp.]